AVMGALPRNTSILFLAGLGEAIPVTVAPASPDTKILYEQIIRVELPPAPVTATSSIVVHPAG
ncbi:hypothetical protein, partial [Mesorhizobium sp.]|uniref:hypothetical protein n=1 Tax=Mesorhizobium sp. TaxID=1871066 RepID=UPI0025E16A9F